MSLDGFLTFLALAVAIYAVVSPVAKLRAKLGWTIQVTLASGAFGLALYLLFFDVIGQPCLFADATICDVVTFSADGVLAPSRAAFLVVIGWMLLAWVVNRIAWRTSTSLPTLSSLVDELVFEQRFAEVLRLVEPHLQLVQQAAHRKLPLQRAYDRLVILSGRVPIAPWNMESKPKPRRWISGITALVPAQNKAKTAAEEIVRALFHSTDIVSFIARHRPYFAIQLLRLDLYGKHSFSDMFFDKLISNTSSVLYQELNQNQNTSSCGYALPESNRLLHFLFADAVVAEKLAVWKPIGDYTLKSLRTDGASDYTAWLNGRAEDFDNERLQDTTYISIFFFDVMVTSAAHQGVQWHMWLYYFPLFVDRLEKLYDTSNTAVDTTAEFPTRSARLIYEVINILGNWVKLVEALPENSPHLNIPEQFNRFDNNNGNIPISAAVALGSCMAKIIGSNKLGDKFAAYMHECIMRDIRNLQQDGVQGHMRQFLIQSIIHGGQYSVEERYGRRLATLWSRADHVLRSDLDDYKKAIQKTYPGVEF